MLSPYKLRKLRTTPAALPNKLKLAMKLGGVTQVQLSEAVRVAQSQVSEDASGNYSEMPLHKAQAYAGFFGCSIEDLFPASEAVAS